MDRVAVFLTQRNFEPFAWYAWIITVVPGMIIEVY